MTTTAATTARSAAKDDVRAGILKARHEARLAAKLQAAAVPVAESTPDEQ